MAGLMEIRSAIVTGAASGIGLATTTPLLEAGWQVAGFDRDGNALAAAMQNLSAYHGRVRLHPLDITDEAASKAAISEIMDGFGPLRGVVTSAGIASNTSFFDTTPDLMRRMNDVNVIGSFLTARIAAETMRDNGGGAIVLIASVSGLVGNRGRTAYGASKGAIVNLTRIMAVELAAHRIRVNAIAPGPIDTAMARQVHSAKVRAEWCDKVPMGRYGTPNEVAQAARFLLDEQQSGYITGQILAVDGGFSIAGLNGGDETA